MFLVMMARTWAVKVTASVLIAILLVLLLLTGFRSRIADALLIMSLAAAIAGTTQSRGQIEFLKKFLSAKRMLLIGILIFSSLTFITASRYGGSLETIFKLIVDRLVVNLKSMSPVL